MEPLLYLLFLIVGLAAGAAGAWLTARGRAQSLQTRLDESRGELQRREGELAGLRDERGALAARHAAAEQDARRIPDLEERLREKESRIDELQKQSADQREHLSQLKTLLDNERKAAAEKLALLDNAERKLADAFKALSSDALRTNNQSFLELARETLRTHQEAAKGDLEKRQQAIQELVKPVSESLGKFNATVQSMEKDREGAYVRLHEQVRSLIQTQTALQGETANLVKALRSPSVRGSWGEIQLRRVIEMAGMLDHCDFYEQKSVEGDEGRLRPDVIVRLPGNKQIVIDAKTPLAAYLEALEAPDDATRLLKMNSHARQVSDQIRKLAQKAYWNQFQPSPEFVVLFLPGENFFQAALEHDPALIEAGVEQGVLPVAPTGLIALLRAAHYGWRQEALAENAREIAELGKELYERVAVMADHWSGLGASLGRAVDSYNKAVGSLETRVLPSARRIKECQISTDREIDVLEPMDQTPRALQAPEMRTTEEDLIILENRPDPAGE